MAATKKSALDLFLAEQLGEAETFSFAGETWTLHSEVPAGAVLKLKALSVKEMGVDTLLEILGAFLNPPSQGERVIDSGWGQTTIRALLRVVMGVYAGQTIEEVVEELRAEQTPTDESTTAAGSPKAP